MMPNQPEWKNEVEKLVWVQSFKKAISWKINSRFGNLLFFLLALAWFALRCKKKYDVGLLSYLDQYTR